MVRAAHLALLAAYVPAHAYLYDVFLTDYKAGCKHGGCMQWSAKQGAGHYFARGKVPVDANSSCALPSATAGADHRANKVEYSFGGPWCFCGDSGTATYCERPQQRVEQLNLQLARQDVIVAGFVTYESLPNEPAMAMLGQSEASMALVKGSSAYFKTPDANREYVMHYVPFRNLQPGKQYYYKVKSGSSGCPWTDVKTFIAPEKSNVTRIAAFGDMGHDTNNNMGNLKDDCETRKIEAIFMMGDHVYYWPLQEHGRGDAYMNAFQPTIESCPWVPIIGNHEYAAADPDAERFTNMAKGVMIGEEGVRHASTADSALGYHLSLGTLLGAGLHSAVPSGTSKYTSTDIGLIHVVAVETQHWSSKQKAWLEKDLAAASANRAEVPWIVVMSHFPTYFTTSELTANISWEAYAGEDGEFDREARYQACDVSGEYCETYGDWHASIISDFEPLLLKYKVDLMGAGHNHRYETTWPMKSGKTCAKSYENPACPVYFVEGNGGVPGRAAAVSDLQDCSHLADWCRKYDTKQTGGYTRLTATRTTLQYDHVQNSDAKVIDSFTIVQNSGPSPPAPTPTPPPAPLPPAPSPPAASHDTLKAGEQLGFNKYLESAGAKAQLKVQGDGNLVLQNAAGKALWSSGTPGHKNDHLSLQKSDGNLVLYDSKTPLWSSGSHKGAAKVMLTDDCDLVKLDSKGNILWHLGTSCSRDIVV